MTKLKNTKLMDEMRESIQDELRIEPEHNMAVKWN